MNVIFMIVYFDGARYMAVDELWRWQYMGYVAKKLIMVFPKVAVGKRRVWLSIYNK